jgi:hypothetical protein
MTKKPFINPSIILKATIKDLRKEVKFWKNQHAKLLRKNARREERAKRKWVW